jgi:hypothetical protein
MRVVTPRQEALAMITAADDPETMRDLWLGKENDAFVLCWELAVQAAAALQFSAIQNNIEPSTLMHRLGIEAAMEDVKRHG